MSKTALVIISLGLVVALGVIFAGGRKEIGGVEIKDGVQYIRIEAGGGYSPQITEAKADIPTKLIMKTSGVFDCSASLVIPSIEYQKMLPQAGETEIDLGTHKVGDKVQGTCSMGMYGFVINFGA